MGVFLIFMQIVQEMKIYHLISTKNIFGLQLKKDVQDWQKRCFIETGQEIHSSCCKAEKDYFKERIRMHTEMCFYSGNLRCERI